MSNRASRLVWTTRDAVRGRLWPIPLGMVLFAIVLGVALPVADRRSDAGRPSWAESIVFGGDPDAARALLEAISASLITVTSLTFSLTVVTLQLASSQFSPRLLRTFTEDLLVQLTLGLFLATFTYALTVLRAVRSSGDGEPGFVPRLAVSIAYVLALGSVVALVMFLAHLTRQIRVETMLYRSRQEALTTIDVVLADRSDRESRGSLPRPPDRASPLLAHASGFLRQVDEGELLSAAQQHDAVISIEVLPGAYVVLGTPIGHTWGRAGVLAGDTVEAIHVSARKALDLGVERTATQDVAFGLRQLTDVVNKAMSPGINDPTTAVHALGHSSTLLAELARRDLGPVLIHGGQEELRLAVNRPGLDQLLDLALAQPRAYGAGDLRVAGRMFTMLGDLAYHARPEDHPLISVELRRLVAAIDRESFDDADRSTLDGLASSARERLNSGPA